MRWVLASLAGWALIRAYRWYLMIGILWPFGIGLVLVEGAVVAAVSVHVLKVCRRVKSKIPGVAYVFVVWSVIVGSICYVLITEADVQNELVTAASVVVAIQIVLSLWVPRETPLG